MLLSEFIKDFGVDKYFRTPKNIQYSLLANFIQLVLEGDWIGSLEIPKDFSQNADIFKYFKELDLEEYDLRFGDVYIIMSPKRYRYGVFLNSNLVLEQTSHLNPQHVQLKDNIKKTIDFNKSKGYKVVTLRPINQKNIFPSDDLRYTKQDKPFANIEYDANAKEYIIYAPGNFATYDDPLWSNDPTNRQIEEKAKQDIFRPLYGAVMRNTGTVLFTPLEGEYDGEVFTKWRIPEAQVDNNEHIFALLQSNTTDYLISDLKWTGNSYHDDLFRKNDKTVTVGTGGDYATVNAAIEALVRSKPLGAYVKHGYYATIVIKAGFVMNEQIIVRGQDLSWITIKSEIVSGNPVEIQVNPASQTIILQRDEAGVLKDDGVPMYTDDLIPLVGVDNGKSPIIGVQFYNPDDGDGYCAAAKDGFAAINGGTLAFLSGSGLRRPRSGVKTLYQSFSRCYIPGMTQGGGGTGGGTKRGIDVSYAQRLAVHTAYGSHVHLPRTMGHHSKGPYGNYAIWQSTCDLYQSNFSYATNGFACTSRDGSSTNLRDSNCSHSIRGIHALHQGRISFRTSNEPLWTGKNLPEGGSLTHCTRYGALASYGSDIEMSGADASYSLGNGAWASNVSRITWIDSGIAQHCVGAGVAAVQNSTIDADGIDVSYSGTPIYAQRASTVNVDSAIATNAVYIGARVIDNSTLNGRNINLQHAGRYGVWADRLSRVSVRGGNLRYAGQNGIAAFEGAWVDARTTDCRDTGGYTPEPIPVDPDDPDPPTEPEIPVLDYSGYFIDRLGVIIIGEPESDVINGTYNKAINVWTAYGLISNRNRPEPLENVATSGFLYKGTYVPGTNVATPLSGTTYGLSNGTGHTGDTYRITTAGIRNFGSGNITFAVDDLVYYDGAVWHKLDTSDKKHGMKVVSGGAGWSLTGSTTETTLVTLTIPAGALGPNGFIELTTNWSMTNNANAKTCRVRLGGVSGTQFLNSPVSSNARLHTLTVISNRNAENSQIGGTNAGNQPTYGQSTSGAASSTVDTTVDTTIVISGQLADGADTVKLESYILKYHYQA